MKKVVAGIVIFSFLVLVLLVIIVWDDTDTQISLNSQQMVDDAQHLEGSWEELETFYFADANKKGWSTLTITNSQGEEREYEKRNEDWVRKSDNIQTNTQAVTPQNTPKTKIAIKEDLTQYPASMLLFYFNSVYANIEYLEKVISSLDTKIGWTTERKNFLENTNKYNDEAINLMIEYDEESLEKYEEYMTFFKKMLDLENEDLSWAKKTDDYLKQRVYENKEEAAKEAEKINAAFDRHSEKSKVISEQVTIIWELYKRKEETFLKGLDIYSNNLEANKPTSNYYIPSSYRQPTVTPQIQIPKTTYCTMGSMAGTLSHYTISCY